MIFFWVFGTEVMVKVAKSFDAPIKLLFPQPSGDPPSLLGLGDIVIPGLFVALMLRFDYVLQQREREKAGKKKSKTPSIKIYFWWQMFGYFIGLTTTVLSMYYFKAAQPALLYLVPTALISSLGLAVYRNEFWPLVQFDEEKEKEKEEQKKTEQGNENATNTQHEDANNSETTNQSKNAKKKFKERSRNYFS